MSSSFNIQSKLPLQLSPVLSLVTWEKSLTHLSLGSSESEMSPAGDKQGPSALKREKDFCAGVSRVHGKSFALDLKGEREKTRPARDKPRHGHRDLRGLFQLEWFYYSTIKKPKILPLTPGSKQGIDLQGPPVSSLIPCHQKDREENYLCSRPLNQSSQGPGVS